MELMLHDSKVSKAGLEEIMVTVTQSSWLVPMLWGTSAAVKEFQLLWHCHVERPQVGPLVDSSSGAPSQQQLSVACQADEPCWAASPVEPSDNAAPSDLLL